MKVNADLTVNIDDLNEFQNKIGIKFNNNRYLIQSLWHSSLFSGDKTKSEVFKIINKLEDYNYEKQEYLGDSVLDLIVAEYSYKNKIIEEYAKAQGLKIEGVLTDVKKVIVSNESLKPLAHKINLDEYILIGVLENITDVHAKVIEALIGGIFLDKGYTEAKKFVYNFFDLEDALGKIGDSNPKGTLKEICDKIGCVPVYEVINEDGPDNNKKFTVRLICNEKITIGQGPKIKKAEANAAKTFLIKHENGGV